MLFKGSVQQNLEEQLLEKETIKDHQRSVSLRTETQVLWESQNLEGKRCSGNSGTRIVMRQGIILFAVQTCTKQLENIGLAQNFVKMSISYVKTQRNSLANQYILTELTKTWFTQSSLGLPETLSEDMSQNQLGEGQCLS